MKKQKLTKMTNWIDAHEKLPNQAGFYLGWIRPSTSDDNMGHAEVLTYLLLSNKWYSQGEPIDDWHHITHWCDITIPENKIKDLRIFKQDRSELLRSEILGEYTELEFDAPTNSFIRVKRRRGMRGA